MVLCASASKCMTDFAWVAGLLGTVCQSALKQIWQLNITGMTVSTLKCISSDLLAYYNAVGAVHSMCRVKWVCTVLIIKALRESVESNDLQIIHILQPFHIENNIF